MAYMLTKNGGVAFLQGHEDCLENESTYSEFIKNIDTVLWVGNTYNQIITELSPDNWFMTIY